MMSVQQSFEVLLARLSGKDPPPIFEWNALRAQHRSQRLYLRGRRFAGLTLPSIDFSNCDLSNSEFFNSNLDGANLSNSILVEADFDSGSLARATFADTKATRCRFVDCTLDDATVERSSFCHSVLDSAYLERVTVRDSDFDHAIFDGSKLTEARFVRTGLRGSSFKGGDEYHQTCYQCILSGTEFIDCNLAGADFRGAMMSGTVLLSDLSEAIGLAEVRHAGTSELSVRQLVAAQSPLPGEFLRGCGLHPNTQQLLSGKLARNEHGTTLSLSKCFISYSTDDKAFVEILRNELNTRGVEYWYAPDHAEWGKSAKMQFAEQIRRCDRLLLICSRTSLASNWVRYELETAVAEEEARESAGRRDWRMVFPLAIDDSLFSWDDHLRPRLLAVIAGDFRGALEQGPAFQHAVEKLVQGLRRSP